MLPSCLRKFLPIIISLIVYSQISAQTLIPDVPKAFNAIDVTPQLVRLKNIGVKTPVGGHLQGIQVTANNHMLITASSGSVSYYLTGKLEANSAKGQINKLQKIADSPFRHAGGCQLNRNQLLVGVEDNMAKNKSDIVIITFNDSLQQTGQRIIAHRTGPVKRATAGASGFAQLKTGEYLLAIGDWDSRNIDFYLSKPGNDTSFSLYSEFQTDDPQWPSYQSINLVTDTAGITYLIGFALDGTHNRADLFEVEFDKKRAALKLVNTRNFNCRGGAGFRYASGISIANNDSLVIYSCARNMGKLLALNIFRNKH